MRHTPKNILKTYIRSQTSPSGTHHIDKEHFLPSVAYIVDGQIKDFMFDSFTFLPSPNYVYDFSRPGAPKREKKKTDWLEYISCEEFAEGKNIDALNAAVGEAKAALGREDYRTNVFLSVFYPVSTVTEFGEVEGRVLNFNRPEDQIAALKWMVDESIRQFEARGYEHITLAGFYWFHESIRETDNTAIHRALTEYVRSLGYITIWGPYFGARGYNFWQEECGFDMVAMQANYFPAAPGAPNCGTIERLKQTADYTLSHNMGVELEWAGEVGEEMVAVGFKQYMQAGIETGYINSYHYYYITFGPNTVHEIYCSKLAHTRSVYDELYGFLQGTLSAADIVYPHPQSKIHITKQEGECI